MLRYRLITAPMLILALLGLIVFDDWLETARLPESVAEAIGRPDLPKGLPIFVVALLLAFLGGIELNGIFDAQRIKTRRWLTCLAAMLGLTLSYAVPLDTTVITSIAVISTGMIFMFVLSLLTFSRQQNVEGVVAAAGAVMFSMVYLGFMFGFLLALRRSHSAWLIVGVIFTTKACDMGAYFIGRAIGRHKLIPWLSPGKTWEGSIGGVLSSVLAGILCALLSGLLPDEIDHVPVWLGALCGASFGIIAQFGDLTMSLLKRGAGLKDSSNILPGMGGVMDVLDSPLMVAPAAFWLLTLL